MACNQCQGAGIPCTHNIVYSCSPLNITKGTNYDASCIYYTGAALTCTGIEPNTDLEKVLQIMDSKICNSNSTDFSLYDLACLDDDIIITTEQEWVEKVAADICALKVVAEGIPDAEENIQTLQIQVGSITQPNLTLPEITNTSPSDSLNELLVGIANAVDTVNNNQSITAVNWDSVYTSTSEPTNLTEGFEEILAQMALLKSQAEDLGELPTFNTIGYCLSHSDANTPLITVINDLILKSCDYPTWDANSVSFGCVTPQGGDDYSLSGSVGGILNSLNLLYSERKSFNNEHFITSAVDGCGGSTISLRADNLGIGKILSSSTDSAAGYLSGKVVAGSNITINTSNPNQITISATVPAATSQVKINADDPSADFLENKFLNSGITNGISIQMVNVDDESLRLNVTVDTDILAAALAEKILTFIAATPERKTQFCDIVADC